MYVTGWTYSFDFPTTPGAFDTTYGDGDGFVSKLDPTGSTLEYSTYIGGSTFDFADTIAVGWDGAAYVGGYTASDDFPTTPGAYDPTWNGTTDGFVAELNPAGDDLVFSTYLGGSDSNNDAVTALALGQGGAVSVTGNTMSADFPTTPGAFDTVINDDGQGLFEDGFVTQLNPDGSGLVYSTFLGGGTNDYGYGITVGSGGTAYVTGETQSGDFPTTPGAFDPSADGGGDVFVTRVNTQGSALTFSTYVGGGGDDFGNSVAVDPGGAVYVVGATNSPDYPTTPGAYDTTINSSIYSDTFATKVDATGSSLGYSTFLGGKDYDAATDLVLDPDGTLTLTGVSYSSNFPTTPGAFQSHRGGSGDAIVSRFDPTGSYLVYSSYLGGSGVVVDVGDAIASAGPGAVTVAGRTKNADFPVTSGAYDASYNGGLDVFVATLQVAKTMHVASIDPGYRPDGPGYDVRARISIVYANGSSASGATLLVRIDYPDGSKIKVTTMTGRKGEAIVLRRVMATGTYTFTVLNVVKPPAVYDSSQNIETSDSVTIP